MVPRIILERRDLGEEARRLFDLVGADYSTAETLECNPPLDLVETEGTVELTMDLPGVAAEEIQIVCGRRLLVIGGRKLPRACQHGDEAAFHLAERTFGRFARAVRLSGAFDMSRVRATLSSGELRIVLPRIEDRRGRVMRIPVHAQ